MTEFMQNAIEELKKALSESEELREYNAAKEAYTGDAELMRAVNEYNLQTAILEQEGSKSPDERDPELIKSISDRLRAVYSGIERSENLARMRAAEDAISQVINELNVAVRLTISPESEQNCTHDCSTCGGCG